MLTTKTKPVTTNSSTSGTGSISNISKWKDLPYRLCTICIGIPILWNYIWCHDTIRVISFYVIHTLCTFEYIYSITTSDSTPATTRTPTTTTASSLLNSHNNNIKTHHYNPHQYHWHCHLYMILSFLLLYIPILYFVPLFIITMAMVTIITMTMLLLQQQQQQQSSETTTITTEPPITTTAITNMSTTNNNKNVTTSPMIKHYIYIMIIWFHGLLFITIPFRSWIAVTTTTATAATTIAAIAITTTSNNTVSVSGFQPTISLLFTVWNCDTGALVFGRFFGQRYQPSLSPPNNNNNNNNNNDSSSSSIRSSANNSTRRILQKIRKCLYLISPSKSLEGLLGGILCGTITYAYLLPIFWYYIPQYVSMGSTNMNNDVYCDTTTMTTTTTTTATTVMTNIGIGLLLSIGAIVGDVLESIIKRYHHCKDSGSLLPGHGGIYDRFDSNLISVVLYHYCILSLSSSNSDNNNNNQCSSIIANRGY